MLIQIPNPASFQNDRGHIASPLEPPPPPRPSSQHFLLPRSKLHGYVVSTAVFLNDTKPLLLPSFHHSFLFARFVNILYLYANLHTRQFFYFTLSLPFTISHFFSLSFLLLLFLILPLHHSFLFPFSLLIPSFFNFPHILPYLPHSSHLSSFLLYFIPSLPHILPIFTNLSVFLFSLFSLFIY